MKIKIEIPYNYQIVIETTANAGLLLQELSNAKLVRSEGYGKDIVWHAAEKEDKINFEIVADDFFITSNDEISKLIKENEATTNRWLEEHTAKQKIEKELADLKTSLNQRGTSIE